jgi:hypothetical protein
MKILSAIKTGSYRCLKAWKGILILWVISFFSVSLIVIPLKAGLKSSLGSSMITEKLVKGIDIDVLEDLGTNLYSMVAFLTSGLLILSMMAILLNVFITGGLFDSVKKGSAGFSSENFFRASARNFWSYMIITLMLYLIIIALIIIVVVVPVSIVSNAESAPEGMVFRIFVVCLSVFMLAMMLILLVADYARAWQASRTQSAGFKALGYGFSQTFNTFLSSFPLMLIMLVSQAIVSWIVIKVITGIVPTKEGGVFLLFVISQLVIFLKLFLKVLRYGSITSMMEKNLLEEWGEKEQPLIYYTEETALNMEIKPDSESLI